VVSCEPEQQLSRLAARRDRAHEAGMTEAQARRRVAAQLPLDDKCGRAHFVLDNSAGVEQTREQVTSTGV
jgi:dephospho-CoA kinase